METFWTIEEWIPAENAIGNNGFWYFLPDSRIYAHDQALRTFEKLKKDDRKVRLIENTRRIL